MTRSMVTAAACAVAAHKLEQPVFYQLDRNEDLRMNGGMQPSFCLIPHPDPHILFDYQHVDPFCKYVMSADENDGFGGWCLGVSDSCTLASSMMAREQ